MTLDELRQKKRSLITDNQGREVALGLTWEETQEWLRLSEMALLTHEHADRFIGLSEQHETACIEAALPHSHNGFVRRTIG